MTARVACWNIAATEEVSVLYVAEEVAPAALFREIEVELRETGSAKAPNASLQAMWRTFFRDSEAAGGVPEVRTRIMTSLPLAVVKEGMKKPW